MKDYYPDGTRKNPIICFAGNPPDLPESVCRWYAEDDGECYDPDHSCPNESRACCDNCCISEGCKYSCRVVD